MARSHLIPSQSADLGRARPPGGPFAFRSGLPGGQALPLKVLALFGAITTVAIAQPVDFASEIRPLLNQSCVGCHGGVKAAGDVSFVYRDVLEATGKKSGKRVIVPGKPEESELIARITSTDKEYRMPPADHGPALPADKVALLSAWIKQGAPWQDHWAFVAPKLPAVPRVAGARAPIDAFVRARLAKENIKPAPEASRPALLRRASLDLIGLPPTPEEIAAFVADKTPDAFEKQVDRLLASPHFGERWASPWLDLARYADTKGYEADRERTVWPFRDWVVDALNRNQPYDRFVIEQLAGDLLPDATLSTHVATAFHRLTQVNDEGGTDDEEFRTMAVIDRVATTWQMTGAVTFGCVQCHAHPYDPIRHQDYYRFFAFLNGTRDWDFNDEHPTLRVPDQPERRDDAWRLRREVEALRREVIAAGKSVEADAAQWRALLIATARSTPEANLSVREGVLLAEGAVPTNARYELSLPIAGSSTPITALRLEVPPENAELARHTPERGFIVTQVDVALIGPNGEEKPLDVGRFFPDAYNLETPKTKTLPRPEEKRVPEAVTESANDATPAPVVAATPAPKPTEVGPDLRAGRPPASANNGLPGGQALPQSANAQRSAVGASSLARSTPTNTDIAVVPPATASAPKQGKQKAGKAIATKAGATKGGPPAPPPETRDVTLDFHFAANPALNRSRWVVAALKEPLPAGTESSLRIRVSHGRQIASKPATIARMRVATSADDRWTALARDPEIARKAARVSEALAELAKVPGTELPVMAEMPAGEGRETRLFHRGNFLEKTGVALAAGVPSLFPPLPANAPANRLTLAQWFFQPGQPLTARVAVNRFWEQLFGTGIVATVEDFGSVGERPSHPELLDWLAVHFERDLKWNIKALLREIVLSATYRQDGGIRPELQERDPMNRLLARGPRQRLTAEMVRDQALAASGLLSRKMGGAPVMPPQPPGVWQTVYNNKDWVESKGEDRYRRSLYTFWKRSAAYPSFLTFDMTARDLCTVRRTPTNTPLQALVTLNDVAYAEAAAALAQRAARDLADGGIDARIARAFELVVSRLPTPVESARLRQLYDESLQAATALSTANGHDEPGVRAMRDVATAILNVDAAFVR